MNKPDSRHDVEKKTQYDFFSRESIIENLIVPALNR